MEISKYNIKLQRVSEDHLELLRSWRNSDYVNSKMIFNQYITSEMQKIWFESMNNDKNYYFIAIYNKEYVGVIHVKNIINNAGEGGIFLISADYENTDVVARMVMCFNDFLFDDLKLDYIYAQIQHDNIKAISSSLAQGCIKDDINSTDKITALILKPDNYRKKTHKIKQILNK